MARKQLGAAPSGATDAATKGYVDGLLAGSASNRLIGEVIPWPAAAIPTSWLECNGQAVSRSTYSALFSVIGTTYGAGDGSTTFNVPSYQGRTLVGLDTTQAEFDVLGEIGGAKTHTLTVDQMPSHTHVQNSHNHTQNAHTHPPLIGTNYLNTYVSVTGIATGTGKVAGDAGSANATTGSTTATNQAATATNQNTGGGQAHNNLQPYAVARYIIKAAYASGEVAPTTHVHVAAEIQDFPTAVQATSSLLTTQNANALTTAGRYYWPGLSNAYTADELGWPTYVESPVLVAPAGVVEVTRQGNQIQQTFSSMTGQSRRWIRLFNGSSWLTWAEVLTVDAFGSATVPGSFSAGQHITASHLASSTASVGGSPVGAYVRAARRSGSGSFAAGAMTSIVAVTTTADAPAGLYLVTWTAIASSSATALCYVRGLWGSNNLTNDDVFTVDGGHRRTHTIPTFINHVGGAATLTMQVQVSAGTGDAPAGSRIAAVYLGSALPNIAL
jgi:microcystin-dependent protein